MDKNKRIFYDNEDLEKIQEMLTIAWERIYFQYKGRDYLVEYQTDGYIIVEPYLFEEEGGFAEETNAAYPFHLQAKTPEEFFALPFLDGKTLFEQFDKLRFFEP